LALSEVPNIKKRLEHLAFKQSFEAKSAEVEVSLLSRSLLYASRVSVVLIIFSNYFLFLLTARY
jgi:hypothetical protein